MGGSATSRLTDTSVCTDPPGFDVDVVVTTQPVELMRIFSGIIGYREALLRGTIAVIGPTRLTTALPHWFAWSPFAPAVRKQLAAQV